MSRPSVALAVTGSIAAYKAVEVARLLVARGVRVRPVLTRSAAAFLGPTTLAAVCGEPVASEMFDPSFAGERHVALGAEVDLVLVVPATADFLARLAAGRADDLVAALALCTHAPILAAPAMHERMWTHPATRRNVATLASDGRVELVGPVSGALASGEVGVGRLADPEVIVARALERLGSASDLAGVRLVVTAGPTVEDLDPVRFLGNRSSGRMGFAVAERAARRGATVTLVAGPVALATPAGVARVDVRSALEMQAALDAALGPALGGADALVMAAAVSDYRPLVQSADKTKKAGERLTLDLVRNPDLLAEIGARRTGATPVLVGFAVETGDDAAIVAYAREKLARKRVDLVVANGAAEAFAGDDNRVVFVDARAATPQPTASKLAVADQILDRVRDALAAQRGAC